MENKQKIIVAILARNCADNLEKNIKELEKLQDYFYLDYYVIENDSTDNTKEILKNWSNDNEHVKLISFNNLDFPIENQINGNRIQRMVAYRNLYMDGISKMTEVEYNYLVMLDIDVDSFSSVEIYDSIKNKPEDAVAVFSNGKYYYKLFNKCITTNYYDLYALRIKGNSNNINNLYYINKHFKRERFITCDSAFAGIGIYDFSKIKNIRYVYQEVDNQAICEHIFFNSEAKKKGNLYIDSELTVLYEPISFLQFIKFIIFPLSLKKIFLGVKI